MVNRLFFSALLFTSFFQLNIHAQDICISGCIIEETGLTIPYCNVILYDKQDSIMVAKLVSDSNGLFTIQTNTNNTYLLEISMLGFDKKILLLDVKDKNIQLGDIPLKESVINLTEVTITASKNEIEFSPGKTTVNLSSLLMKASSNILDVLKTMPGVFIREDGIVSLNGQINSQIIVNGKPTYLSGDNLISLLRSMPATSVSKIELITHPSALYDAAGSSGVINLHINRHFYRGISLSTHIRYNQGKYTSGDIGFNFAYRNSKLCLFSDYSYYTGNGYNDLNVMREDLDYITQKPIDKFIYQHTYRKWKYDSHYYRVGLDYDISSKTYLGIYTNGFIMDRKQNGDINSRIIEPENLLRSKLFTNNKNNKYPCSYKGGIDISYKPEKETEWNNYFDFVYHNQPEDHFQHDTFNDFVSGRQKQDTLKGNMGGKIHIYAGESNIAFPIGKNKVRAGAKTSFISVNNSSVYHNLDNNKWIEMASLSRQFSYNENINAAYLQFETRFSDKLSTQIGLRVENTNVKGTISQYNTNTESSYSHHYTHLFPSVTLEYKLQNGNALSALYSRRINRPNYNDMNPFVYIFDNYMHEQGNPDLKPSLSDNIELSFVFKNKLKASIFVLHVNEPISKSFHQIENDLILVYPDNLSSSYSYGVRLNSTVFNPTIWWNISANLTLNYKKYKWFFFDKGERVSVFSPHMGLNNQFEFAEKWAAEVHLSYRGKNADGQYSFKPIFIGNVGIRRQILKDNGTISFTIDDIFESNLQKGKVQMPGRLYISRERELGRLFRISFSYRFRQGKEAIKANRKRGIDESDRI
ncbi:MAG: TonB-dependent receptor [Dysgonomonas sp.]|nr:TonB-dependent receptor [Dysgonomonas sp.]